MSMSQKDFVLIAEVMHKAEAKAFASEGVPPSDLVVDATDMLADAFEKAYERFDRDKFLLAVEEGPKVKA